MLIGCDMWVFGESLFEVVVVGMVLVGVDCVLLGVLFMLVVVVVVVCE